MRAPAHSRSAPTLRVDPDAQAPFIYWQPCLGVLPIVIESPGWFFGVQLLAGVGSLLTSLLMEAVR
jgi:hypothetical protein